MFILKKALILLPLALLCSAAALAEEDDPLKEQHWLFLGGAGGYSYLFTDVSTELDKDGYQFDLKGRYSYSWDWVTLDLGLGWLVNRMSGNTAVPPVVKEVVTTKSVFNELALRYRITPMIEVGSLTHFIYGTDSGFGSTDPNSSNVTIQSGVEGTYTIPWQYPVRFNVALLSDFNISNRQVLTTLAGVQIGLPIGNWIQNWTTKSTPEPKPVPEAKPKPVLAPKPKPAPATVVEDFEAVPQVAVTMDFGLIHFDTDSATLSEQSEEMLKRIGYFLNENNDKWQRLRVEGHTDSRGSYEYNLDLSERRAASVRDALYVGGVDTTRVIAKGFSFSRPAVEGTGEEVWSQNRRVELAFDKVEDPDFFKTEIGKIQKEYFPDADIKIK